MKSVTVNIEDAPKFIAQLVREGIAFDAKQIASHETDAAADVVRIEITGF